MKFVKGMAKLPNSGRKPGVKNKRTIAFMEACDDKGFLIVDEFIKLFDESTNENLKLEILKEMAKYSYTVPKEPDKNPDDDKENQFDLLKDVSSPELKALLTKKETNE